MVIIALFYPALRVTHLFPTELITETVSSFSPDRAQSIEFRFDNEEQLLARALERPWFGWGRFGRNRILDPVSGKDDSVVDGRWISTIGQFGVFGFIAEFGFLSMIVFRAALSLRYARSNEDKIFLSTLSLIVSAVLLDSLPNAPLDPWTVMLFGTLCGRTEALRTLANEPRLNRARMSSTIFPSGMRQGKNSRSI